MDWLRISPEVHLMISFIFGICLGFMVGYGLGLFIDRLDKRIKNGGR